MSVTKHPRKIKIKLFKKYLFLKIFNLTSWLPDGLLTAKLRNILVKRAVEVCGNGVRVGQGAKINTRLRIGNRVLLGPNMRTMCYGNLVIKDDVLIGPDVTFIDTNHSFNSIDIPISRQGYSHSRPIIIEQGAWIGTKVTILPGVTIGKGAIVSAGAVVNRDVPPFSIAGGVPAKFLKNRTNVSGTKKNVNL